MLEGLGLALQQAATASTINSACVDKRGDSTQLTPRKTHVVTACIEQASTLLLLLVLLQVARYLTPCMLAAAAAAGIQLKQIDPSAPLQDQGPFHLILHKLGPNPGACVYVGGCSRLSATGACRCVYAQTEAEEHPIEVCP